MVNHAYYDLKMHHPFFFETQHVGMRMRVACSSVIYRKVITISDTFQPRTV